MVGEVAKERIRNRECVTSLASLDVMTPAEYGAWLLYDSLGLLQNSIQAL